MPPDEELHMVATALRESPRVLVLGQNYLATHDERNPLFVGLAARQVEPSLNFYEWWLQGSDDIRQRLDAVMDVGKAVNPDESIRSMLNRSWSCVFSSSFDSVTNRLLTVEDRREVHQIFSSRFSQSGGAALKLVRLFGSVDRPSSQEWPPATSDELRRRRAQAAEMIARIGEITSPNGHVYIEGWDPRRDWLRPRDFAPGLASFVQGQVLIFGLDREQEEELLEDDDFGYLMDTAVVKVFRTRLVDMMAELEVRGQLQNVDNLALESPTISYAVARTTPETWRPVPDDQLEFLAISRTEWRRLSERMTIIEPIDVSEPLPASDADRYMSFHRFLANRPESSWPWLSSLAFRRPVLDKVVKPVVLDFCKQRAPQDHAVILYGQSGSGKTVMLNLLALEARAAGFPVIFVSQDILPLNQKHVDDFCFSVEKVSSVPVIIIYDGTQDDSEYLELAEYLSSRGRKCLVVGSSYGRGKRIPRRSGRRAYGSIKSRAISISVDLDTAERKDLLTHIESFLPVPEADLERLLQEGYDSFFALLYRLLPPTQSRIKTSIIREINQNVEDFRRAMERVDANGYQGATPMEQALRKALGDALDELAPEVVQVAATSEGQRYEVTDALLLFNAVMLASRVKLPLPQEMALRLLRQGYAAYRECTRNTDAIMEVSIGLGDQIALSARNRLEADVWIERHLPYSKHQIDLITQLVSTISSAEMEDDNGFELNFVVKLLQAIGPQAESRFKLSSHFLEIAEIIARLRELYSYVHPRLLLIQCNATREWVQHEQDRLDGIVPETAREQLPEKVEQAWLPKLQSAEEAIDAARDAIQRNVLGDRLPPGARRLVAVLETERAAVLGVQQGCVKRLCRLPGCDLRALVRRADDLLGRATSAWRESLRYNEDNFRALDVACWVIRDRLEMAVPSVERQAELLADWSDIVDRYLSTELPPSQYDQRDRREGELAQALGDVQRFEDVAARAAARGSTAARTLKARFIEKHDGPQAAREYLEESCQDVLLLDRAVLLLYTRLWWQTETGLQGYFPEERLRLAFTGTQWSRLEELSRARLVQEGEGENGTALFLLGWSLMQLDQTNESRDIFRRLQIINVGGSRNSRSLALLTDDRGRPRTHIGDVRGWFRENRAFAWVDALRMEVPFNPAEFEEAANARPGQVVGPFHVALNYRGVYAEPLWRAQPRDETPR